MTPESLNRLRTMGLEACYSAALLLPEDGLRRAIARRMAGDFDHAFTAKRAYDLAADCVGHATSNDVPAPVRDHLLDAAALAEAIGDAIALAERP